MKIRGSHYYVPCDSKPNWKGKIQETTIRFNDPNHTGFWLEVTLSPVEIVKMYKFLKGKHDGESLPAGSDKTC